MDGCIVQFAALTKRSVPCFVLFERIVERDVIGRIVCASFSLRFVVVECLSSTVMKPRRNGGGRDMVSFGMSTGNIFASGKIDGV